MKSGAGHVSLSSRAKIGSEKAGVSVLSVAIEDYKAGLEKFAGMFSGNYGVRVIFRGVQAMTNGKTIVVPDLSLLERKNMTDQETREAMDYLTCTRGFVYHEGAHIIFSDLGHKTKQRVDRVGGGKKFMQLWNILEDSRIERAVAKVYPGAKETLAFTRSFAMNETKKAFDAYAAMGQPFSDYTNLIYAISLLGNLDKQGKKHPLWKTLKLPARQRARELKDLINEARCAQSTDECLDVAEKIWKSLQEHPDPEPPQPQPQDGGEESDEQDDSSDSEQEQDSDSKSKKQKGKSKKKQKQKDKKKDKKKQKSKSKEKDDDEDSDQEDEEDKGSGSSGEEDDEEETEGSQGEDESDDEDDDEDGDGGGAGEDDEDPEEDGEDDDNDGDDGSGEEGSEDEDDDQQGESQEKDVGDDEDDDGDSESEGDRDSSGEDDDSGASEDSDSGDDSGKQDHDDSSEEDGDDDDSPGKPKEPGADKANFDLKNSDNKDDIRDTKDVLSDKVRKEASKQPHGVYRVFTTEYDTIGPPPETPSLREQLKAFAVQMDAETRSIYGPLQRNLENMLKAKTQTYVVRGLDEGELDIGSLYKLAQAKHYKSPHMQNQARSIFQQRAKTLSLEDTVVELTVDKSGSMQGVGRDTTERKDRLAMKSAFILGSALNGVGVPFEVSTWSTDLSQAWNQCAPADRHLFTRFSALQFLILKSFDEDWMQKRSNIAHMAAYRTNLDGESIWVAASRLLARKERRKVLFVLSDGLPSGEEVDNRYAVEKHLHESVARCRGSGVEVYAVGIGAPEVERYYKPHFVNVTNAANLPKQMIDMLKRTLGLK